MRKGRDFYSKNYEKAIELYGRGAQIKDIAQQLNVSYSAAYHWVKGVRKPQKGNLNDFERLLREKGPMPVAEIKEAFPKHNEIFLTASRRGFPLKRFITEKKFGDYATWYFVEGQEHLLKQQITELASKYKELRAKIIESLALE